MYLTGTCLSFRQALAVGCPEINDQAYDGFAGEFAAADPEPANFNQARERWRWTDDQLALSRLQMHAVVTNQQGGRNLPGAAGQDQIEREARLAGTRSPADQHGASSHQHRRAVNAGVSGPRHGAGSLTTKRAPAMLGSPSAPGGPARFSAQIRPP